MASDLVAPSRARVIAVAGNPNAGKTTLFNLLTGLRQKVGNYPGVTVERKEGRLNLPGGVEATLVDLPGTYSLLPKSPDEEIARDVLLGLQAGVPAPDMVVIVLDASNLERNLYLTTQILELGIPSVVALNMTDLAAASGRTVDADQLSQDLGCPVVEIVALRGKGLEELRTVLAGDLVVPRPPQVVLPEPLESCRSRLANLITSHQATQPGSSHLNASGAALRLLGGNAPIKAVSNRFGAEVAAALQQISADPSLKVTLESAPRFAALAPIARRALHNSEVSGRRTFTDRADTALTHPFFGLVFFAVITFAVFQAISRLAEWPMGFIENGTAWAGNFVTGRLPEGPLRDLMVDGVVAGVGGVVMFLPQILILFFFIGILEDSGYMARAAFIMDRHMARVGLHGRAFIPLISSFACAIPGIMATRTIATRRDRMVTILIAPLMSCSARLPVYFLMIGTFFPDKTLVSLLGIPLMGTRALILLSLYILGIVCAMAAAWLFKKTLFPGSPPSLMIELPAYKTPAWRNVVTTMWARGSEFLKRAGTIIFALSIILWFLLSYPKIGADQLPPGASEEQVAALQLDHSVAGRVGHLLEPVIAPIGFNWKIGIGLIGAMAAREVFVSTMGTVYATADADENSVPLRQAMKNDRWPDGSEVWTPLTAVSLLVYFVVSMQCLATLAVVKRETDSIKWPLFMLAYMTGLAWFLSFVVYQGGRLMGWG